MTSQSKCLPAAIAALAVLLSACASASDNGRSFSSSGCQPPGGPVIAEAVTQYLEKLSPMPQRYLVQSMGDSALPDPGREVLQAKGPTYLFPTDTAKQQAVISMLIEKGPFPTLLVLFGGVQPADGGQAAVTLGGRYTGEVAQPAPTKAVYFNCQDEKWVFSRAVELKAS